MDGDDRPCAKWGVSRKTTGVEFTSALPSRNKKREIAVTSTSTLSPYGLKFNISSVGRGEKNEGAACLLHSLQRDFFLFVVFVFLLNLRPKM
jgi:hypothetical protein